MSYKDTIRLPQTAFSMKGSLIVKEPEMLLAWHEKGLEQSIRRARSGAQRFVLHDGPPYANGHVHLGTALNKILKDFIVKSHTMMGFDSPYTPGWDCHGMPIEHRVTRAEGAESLSRSEIRARCREYADRFYRVQRDEFSRLGVFGSWDHPYLTMARYYEAGIVRAFGELVRSGFVYEGLRPIHWCTSCKTALADAEVEYGAHSSPSVYVAFRPLRTAEWRERGIGEDVEVVIWTTTPWTLPANMAVALNPNERYCVVVLEGGRRALLASRRVEAFLLDSGLRGEVEAGSEVSGSALEKLSLEHPL
ncbi:class I tRNA ligase family protein, partial [Candidatus Fermentibacterales bacterium]|nr:class I tRNA ligase family protein [Candidatus Fermentibacterales bacterium]